MGVWCAKFQPESLFIHKSSHQTEVWVTLFFLPQIQQREEVELLEDVSEVLNTINPRNNQI